MYPISTLFNDLLHRRGREFIVKIEIDGETYDSDMIVDFSVDNSLTLSNEFEIGTAIPSKLSLRMWLTHAVPANARVVPYVALSGEGITWMDATFPWRETELPWSGGHTDWMPMGEFFVDNREKINNVWTYTCYDKLVRANVPYVSSLTYPTTQRAVWDEICGRLGYTYDSSVQINSSYTVPVAPTGYSMRQVMQYIAGANSASVYVSKVGTIKFRRFTAASAPVFSMSTDEYVRVKQTNPIKTYTRVVVTYNPDDKLTYEAGSGDENHTLRLVNPLATQAVVNDLLASIKGLSYMPIDMDASGFPHLEQGDRITFEIDEGHSWLETFTAWQDTHIPWDGRMSYQTIILHQSFGYAGGLKMRIEAPSKSEQQSEFAIEGSLTGQVNKLNKDAVRESRRYYGVTITRQDGLIVEREGGAAKAVLNADELTFYKGSSKALWFDVANNRYKFSGTLEATDGVFSGNLQAAGGTFAGALQAATGTFKGELVAASGTFAGALQAATGTFKGRLEAGEVVGGTITGSTINGTNIIGSTIKGGDIIGTTITGGTVTGTTVRTSISGERVVLQAERGQIEIYDSNNVRGLWIQTISGGVEFSNTIPLRIGSPGFQVVPRGSWSFVNALVSGIKQSAIDDLPARLNSIEQRLAALGG
jgi:hypothetical protein